MDTLNEELNIRSLKREFTNVPKSFVSVYHETKGESLPLIAKNGLLPTHDHPKNLGVTNPWIQEINNTMDMVRPDWVVKAGISRVRNIFAYSYLQNGHGMRGGVDKRHIEHDRLDLEMRYDQICELNTESDLERLIDLEYKWHVKNANDYVNLFTNKEYLRQVFIGGEVLELKVNPDRAYVGDLQHVEEVMTYAYSMENLREGSKIQGEYYWYDLIKLKDFRQYYRQPVFDKDQKSIVNKRDYFEVPNTDNAFWLLKGAPRRMPTMISKPEILIPEIVPPNHIKIL